MEAVRRRQWIAALTLAFAVALLLGWGTLSRHVRAAQLLAHFEDSGSTLAGVEVRDTTLGGCRARVYEGGGPPVLLVHGVHADGIDEPRLVRFAELLVDAGFTVATPDITPMREFRLDAAGIEHIADAAAAFAAAEGRPSVGVVGISFGGGLAILAAAERPEAIHGIWAIGAHHDLVSLARWWSGGEIRGPGGERPGVEPEGYGAQVLAYSFADDFFAPADLEDARVILGAHLRGDSAEARALRDAASGPARARLREAREPGAPLRELAERHHDALATISPVGRLARVRARVLLLHGAGDRVVASTEALHLAAGLPRSEGALRTSLLGHADASGDATWSDRWDLVHHAATALDVLAAPR